MFTILLGCGLTSCGWHREPMPAAQDVEITASPTQDDAAQMQELMSDPRLGKAINDVFMSARERYPAEAFVLVIIITQADSPGVDDWRTCAKLKDEYFGLPPGVEIVTYDQAGRPCQESPRGIVGYALASAPMSQNFYPRPPTYKGERLGIVAHIHGFDHE